MRSFAVAALFAGLAAANMTEIEAKFISYIATHGKSYHSTEEYLFRMELFAEVDAEIEVFNATETSSRHGHNFLSDFTHEERKAMNGYKNMGNAATAVHEATGDVPDWTTGVNWVNTGAVAAIKDQGQCGSCWAFSTNCAVESSWAMYKGNLYSLAEQLLVDCDTGCYGCNGGW